MKLNCNGTVVDDRLHFRFDEDQVNKLYYILLNASIALYGDDLYEDEYEFCNMLLRVVEKSIMETEKRGK